MSTAARRPSAQQKCRFLAPPPPPPYVDFTAAADTAVAGTVSGDVAATRSDNAVTQSIRETESGGRPNRWFVDSGKGILEYLVPEAFAAGRWRALVRYRGRWHV